MKLPTRLLWQTIIQELLNAGLTFEEVKKSLIERYPDRRDLMMLVAELNFGVKGFCKTGQEFGFGYGNPGPTNFSIPNSEGPPGTGLGSLDPTNAASPSSSYTDHAQYRAKKRKEQSEQERRREERKNLVDRLAAFQPGESLTVGPEGVKPGDSLKKLIQNVEDRVRAIDRSFRATEKEHEIAPQWSEEEQKVTEKTIEKTPSTLTTPSTGIPKGMGTTITDVREVGKKMKDITDQGIKETKTLGDTTKKVQDNIETLNKSIQNLLK